MNPQHAQFFRELRELCLRHGMIIESDEPFLFFHTHGAISATHHAYKSLSFDGYTHHVTRMQVESFDTPQKDGEE